MSSASSKRAVWRVRMKSGADGIDVAAARQFALENGIVGAGWRIDNPPEPSPMPDNSDNLDLYIECAKSVYPNDSSVEGVALNFGREMAVGDICWMHASHKGEYWCCHVDGGFRYRTGGNFDAFDLHITRHCTWACAGAADAVPGVVRRAFATQFGTISRMTTSAEIAIEAAEIVLGRRTPAQNGDLFALASPEDLEDIVALYLQQQGWRLLPSTAKVTMASYEFVLVQHETGKRAGVQVKSGNVAHLEQSIADEFDAFFVFLANPTATLEGDPDRIIRIDRDALAVFARQNWKLLPQRLKMRWPLS